MPHFIRRQGLDAACYGLYAYVDYYVETYAYWYGKVFNVSGSKAQTAQPITSVAGGIDGITWYDADSDEDVEVEGDNVVIGDWLINYTFEPSDLDDYRFNEL